MPYDPSKPADHSPLVSAEMRGQLNGLNDKIDATPGVAAAQVDAVDTLAAGQPATASVNFAAGTLHFTFAIPQGNDGTDGTNGADGTNGTDGADGAPGVQGPPFASAVVDSVVTLGPGSDATVSVTFDGSNVRFEFGIPRGSDGTPGEVTNADLAAAIAGATANSSANTNAVPTLDTPFANDPPTLADIEVLRAAYNTLVLALRR